MRIPAVLTSRHLPEPELMTAARDGELLQLGGAFCPVDTIVGAEHRAAVIAAEAPAYAIAERRTAAWIYGAAFELARPLTLCVDSASRKHPVSTHAHLFREVVISAREISTRAGVRVTSPVRTAIDLARFGADFSPSDRETVRRLAELAGFDLAEALAALSQRKNLPNRQRARRRLATALERDQKGS